MMLAVYIADIYCILGSVTHKRGQKNETEVVESKRENGTAERELLADCQVS